MAAATGENRIFVVGAGTGGPERMTPAARRILESCRFVAAGRGQLGLVPDGVKRHLIGHPLEETRLFIAASLAHGDVCVLASGDPGCFSILAYLRENFAGVQLEVEPGISAVQMLAARLRLGWESWELVSLHGRGAASRAIWPGRTTLYFCDEVNKPQDVARLLLEELPDCAAAVGSDLGRDGERVWQGSMLEAAAGDYAPNSLLLVMPEQAAGADGVVYGHRRDRRRPTAPGIPDDAWLRQEGVPLSKSEFRAVLLSRAQPAGRGVIWDIGAGSGSYGIECSLLEPSARVIAIDQNPDACALIVENAARFGARVEVVCRPAPDCFATLPAPDLAIVGGSDGRLEEIFIALVTTVNSGGRLAVTAVLPETRRLAHQLFATSGLERRQSVRVEIARGEGHEWHDLNPVILFTGDIRDG